VSDAKGAVVSERETRERLEVLADLLLQVCQDATTDEERRLIQDVLEAAAEPARSSIGTVIVSHERRAKMLHLALNGEWRRKLEVRKLDETTAALRRFQGGMLALSRLNIPTTQLMGAGVPFLSPEELRRRAARAMESGRGGGDGG